MAKEAKELDMAAAISVSDRVQLNSVKLVACDCKQQGKPPSGQKVFDVGRRAWFELSEEGSSVAVFIQFMLHGYSDEDEHDPKNAFLVINATFCLLYGIENVEGLDEIAFRSFAELNGAYNAWPYWREFVQNVTARMELPPLVVPVFRLPKAPPKDVTKRVQGRSITKKTTKKLAAQKGTKKILGKKRAKRKDKASSMKR